MKSACVQRIYRIVFSVLTVTDKDEGVLLKEMFEFDFYIKNRSVIIFKVFLCLFCEHFFILTAETYLYNSI